MWKYITAWQCLCGNNFLKYLLPSFYLNRGSFFISKCMYVCSLNSMKYVIQRKIMKNMDQVYVATIPYLEPCPNWNRKGNFIHFFQEGWA